MKTPHHLNVISDAENGFTLIETMLALGIFAIGILAVAAMQITAFHGNRSARLQTEAITLSSQHLEEMVSGPYAGIIDGSETVRDFNLDWIVTNDSPVANTKKIIMTTSWGDRGGQKNIQFSYIVTDPS